MTPPHPTPPLTETSLQSLWLHHQVDRFNAAYAAALDEKRYADWLGFFLADAHYRVQARENFDRGLPLCLIHLESQGMMKDRVHGITQTIYHGPYHMRHVISPARVIELERTETGEVLRAEANYAVFRTKPGGVSEVFNVGRYLDEFTWLDGALKLRSRHCVYDSEMILNSLIYPV